MKTKKYLLRDVKKSKDNNAKKYKNKYLKESNVYNN